MLEFGGCLVLVTAKDFKTDLRFQSSVVMALQESAAAAKYSMAR